MEPMVNIALRAARKAGEMIARATERVDLIRIDEKGRNDFVTEIDHAAEKEIIYHLRKAFPDHTILGEESGLLEGDNNDYQWIIDPLDGTHNAIAGIPFFSVSIALLEKGETLLAAVCDLSAGSIYMAEKGMGAYLDEKRLSLPVRTQELILLSTVALDSLHQTQLVCI